MGYFHMQPPILAPPPKKNEMTQKTSRFARCVTESTFSQRITLPIGTQCHQHIQSRWGWGGGGRLLIANHLNQSNREQSIKNTISLVFIELFQSSGRKLWFVLFRVLAVSQSLPLDWIRLLNLIQEDFSVGGSHIEH